ncbi:MAG: lipid kinase [Bacteroidaceae bacterium]|nr:lipid kinase [Bacteroidaceae bacterium]
MAYAIIYCPKHTITSTSGIRKTVEKCFAARKMEYKLFTATKENTVSGYTEEAIREGYKTLVIIGGDRSLNQAANAIMHLPEEERREVRLAVVPNGTINSFSRYWGLCDKTVEDCVDYVEHGTVRRIDVGCINYTNPEGEACHRHFLNCINIGLSAYITRVRHNTRSILWSRKLSFLVSTMILIFQRSVYKMRFSLNHEDVDGSFMTVCIGNCTGYGQTPSAVPYNGMLDVSAVTITPLSGMIMGFYLLLTGKFLKHKNVKPFRTRSVTFREMNSKAVSVDGAMINTPKGEFTIGIAHEALNFIVPYRKQDRQNA